jgi:hypothetical protein
MPGDITDTRVQAAKRLLDGRERIAAKAQDVSAVQAARDHYGTDALDAAEAALEDDRVELTDGVLDAIRDGDDLDSITAGATDLDGRVYRLHGVDTDGHVPSGGV